MRVVRRSFLASTAAGLAAPALMRLAWADAPQFALKLHHALSSVSGAHARFLVPWARKVEAESGGRIRIDIFPSMQLGGAPAQLFDQVRDGVVDIAWAIPSLTPDRFPRIETFDLPFVPARRALVSSKALEDFAAVNLKDEFRDVHPISFSCTDRGVIHANRPIRTLDDVKGLNVHVQTRLTGEAMHLLGARPVPMPISQLALAVTQHVVDACVVPWHVVPGLRLNDVLKTHTDFADWSLSTTTFVLTMNKGTYDRLPRDLKAVIDANSGQPVAGVAGAMWDLQAAAVTDLVVQRGDSVITLLPEAVAHWRKATEPVIEAWQKTMKEQKTDGGKLIAGARALLAKYANEPEPHPSQTPSPAEQQAVTQPEPRPQAKADATPKADVPAPQPPAPAAKPAAKPAPAPRVAAPTPAPAPSPPPVAASAPPAVQPAPLPAPPAPVAQPVAPPVPPPAAAPPPVTP